MKRKLTQQQIAIMIVVGILIIFSHRNFEAISFDFVGVIIFAFLTYAGSKIMKSNKKSINVLGVLIFVIGILGFIVDTLNVLRFLGGNV